MKLLCSIFLLGIVLTTQAQSDKKDKFIPMFTHSIGASYQQFVGLNSRVASLPQFEQLKDYAATLGLGWLKECKQIVTAGSLTISSSMSGHQDRKSSTIRYAGISADIGYDVIKSEKVMLYPFAGLGLQAYQAIFFKDNSGVSFNDVLQSTSTKNTISSVRFNNSFAVYRVGLGFAAQMPKCPGSSIGLQAGFVGSFKNRDWKSNENQTLGNAPVDKINQGFANLVFISTPKFMNR
ncbi:MAG: hypothetical protein H7211_12780 [Aquabacterium sp.]|nr:hypothetical protein [Ferruginibacter sp.]